MATALGAASGSLTLASALLEESDPALASALDVLAFGSGLASLAAGLSGGSRVASRALAGAGTRQNIVGAKQFFTKTMAGVDNYTFVDRCVTVYRDVHKGVARLVINLHGTPSGYGVTGAGALRAEAVIDFLEARGVPIRTYSKVKLHMCHSATPYDVHGSTFARDMAYALKAEVKGYEGEMQVCGLLGERVVPMRDTEFFDVGFDKMKELVGEETILREWRPRKVDWVRDSSSRIVRDANNVPVLKSYPKFNPVTYRCAPGSFKVEVIPGDHSMEKIMARWAKNKHAYVNPFDEDLFQSELQSGGLC
ncbi:hypothetical protein E6B08_17415 [Pseudomonas putida]|uniref:Uncharacterized protein n=1 Tax=Pseudomonas putida TaxID=303 RepID=A0A4D6XAZ8_PSEPU|nr:hypothetical protein [Pseudomonas putida]QCI13039.1 hypothetical protein E6B08_17415 [Pseudomonas putida]